MPSYKITDNQTGRSFKVSGDSPPTEAEAAQIFADFYSANGGDAPSNNPADYPQGKTASEAERMRQEFYKQEASTGTKARDTLKPAMPYVRPLLEGTGAVLGGLAGIPTAPATMGLSSVAGTAGGYAAGKYLADLAEGKPQSAGQTLADLGTGATFEMGGQAVLPVLGMAAKGAGAVIKPVLGRLSGTGSAGEEAIKSGIKSATELNPLKSVTAYDKALRGDISGPEIVESARNALSKIKDMRGAAYKAKLQEVEQATGPLNIDPITNKIYNLADQYNIKIDPTTLAVDESRIAMGKTGRKDIAEIFDLLKQWGTKPEDMTASGLDTLKRQLDDFYSDSSQARQFVTSLKDTVKKTIEDQIPAYGEMTKGYSEATKLIKDVEADLMLRKQGMSGRTTADKTLRRLMSSMRDNFELRNELVDVLGKQGGEDLKGALAGYAQNAILPRGLAGTGPALLTGGAIAKFVDPWFASVLVASSPRVQGEFLRMWGKGIGIAQKTPPQAISNAARQAAISFQSQGE